jgi:hypothetical protein
MLSEFVALLEPINALADESPGFVWRLQTKDGNAAAIRGFDDERLIVNMSVWQSIEQLAEFVYRSDHVAVMRRRREWFERMRFYMTLWWVPEGHVPTVAEAELRLAHLRIHGPTSFAFTFKHRFRRPTLSSRPAHTRTCLAVPPELGELAAALAVGSRCEFASST